MNERREVSKKKKINKVYDHRRRLFVVDDKVQSI